MLLLSQTNQFHHGTEKVFMKLIFNDANTVVVPSSLAECGSFKEK
jgi:hypothetical protein